MESMENLDSDRPGFVCDICQNSYSRAEYLRRHQRKHTEVRPFSCEDCPKQFGRSDVLLRHRRRCHPESAALEEANKPSSSIAGPKKPSRPRNRNARRPYPAPKQTTQAADPNTPESDVESPIDSHSLDFLLEDEGDEPTVASILAEFSQSVSPAQPVDLSWSPNGSNMSGRSVSDSPPQFDDQNVSYSPASTSNMSNSSFLANATNSSFPASTLFEGAPPPFDIVPTEGLVDNLGPPPNISSIEAGVAQWASEDTARSGRGPQSQLNTFGTWYAFPPITVDNDSATNNAVEEQLPNSLMGYANRGLFELVRQGDWASLKERGVDVLDPEFTLIDSESRLRTTFSGERGQFHPTDKFFIPPGLFAGCYTVPHWLLPPIQRLSAFASIAFKNVAVHLNVLHEPTFRLAEAHAWLAFALCTAAGHRQYKTLRLTAEEEPWDAVQSVVRAEKTGMFLRLFAVAGVKVPKAELFTGIQALLLYNAQSFLSENVSDRIMGENVLSTILKTSRRCGILDSEAHWVNPKGPIIESDLQKSWLDWVNLEGCRRTVWLLYLLDIHSTLECAGSPLVLVRDVRNLLLPAPPTTWNAPTAANWALLISHPGAILFTLDAAMQHLFDFSGEVPNQSGELPPSVLDVVPIGPHARTMIVSTLLRGILEYAQGSHHGGSIVQRWALGGPNSKLRCDPTSPHFHQEVVTQFGKALLRWKNGWDMDPLCQADSFHTTPEQHANPVTLFVHDALPLWWMTQLLLNHLSGDEGRAFSGITRMDERTASLMEDDAEGLNRLMGLDLGGIFLTAKSLANPWSLGTSA